MKLLVAASLAILVRVSSSAHLNPAYIIGGHDVAKPGTYPFMASIIQNGHHLCGAALISKRWLISASHCIITTAPRFYRIGLGLHDRITRKQGNPKSYRINKLIRHPGWSRSDLGYRNDIALIRLATDVEFDGEFIDFVRLAMIDQDFEANDNCKILGWQIFLLELILCLFLLIIIGLLLH